jgi:D-alanine transaminase/branched-chain amino acid aminotransferase
MPVTEYAFVNNRIVPAVEAVLNVSDLAFLRGYGIFDYFRVIDGKAVFLEDYLDRLHRSAAGLSLQIPFSREYLTEQIYTLIAMHDYPLMGVRIVCTGGCAQDAYTPVHSNVCMLVKPFDFHPYHQGLKLMTVPYQRELHLIKSINYIIPISLLPKMKTCQADDVLYYHNGLITESSRSNIFMIKNGVLITPSYGMLEGVTRKRIISFAKEIMPMEIRDVTLGEILEADEVFLSASTKRISPVTMIDQCAFSSGPFTKILYDRLILEENR